MNTTDTFLQLLGKQVEDKVTGFAGVVTAVAFDLNGLVQTLVQPPAFGEKWADCRWFDAFRLKVYSSTLDIPTPDFMVHNQSSEIEAMGVQS